MAVPVPTPIFRLVHIANLCHILEDGGMWAPSAEPKAGREYRTIHDTEIQDKRRVARIPCGPDGVIHDYVSFYFGPRSPMLFRLHTGWVQGYTEGQEPLIYLVSMAQVVTESGTAHVFSDGHGIARFTEWFADLAQLEQVDWDAVYARIWKDTPEDPDRQRRKQAEFLVHGFCPWSLIHRIAVANERMRVSVEQILAGFPADVQRLVEVRPDWYY